MKTLAAGDSVYLCLVTWPDGTEGLLFPRPGNAPAAITFEAGMKDYATALKHLDEYVAQQSRYGEAWKLNGTKIRLVKCECVEIVREHEQTA